MRDQQQPTRFGVNRDRIRERGSARPRSKYDSIFINGVTRYTLKAGANTFRVVCEEDAEHWAEIIHVHERIGTKQSTYLCPNKMSGGKKPCPVCDAAEDARRANDKEEYDALKDKERAVCYVVDRADEAAGLKVYDMSWTRENEINIAAETKKGGALFFPDPDNGYDITIQRSGTGLKTRYYGLQIDRESTPLLQSQRKQDALMEQVRKAPLKTLFKYYDPEYLADILNGKVEERDEDEGDTTAARGSGRRAPARQDEADGEDDQREAAPARRGSGRRPSADEQGVDDPDDPPQRTRRGARDEPAARETTRQVRRGTSEDEAPWEEEQEADARPAARRGGNASARAEEYEGEDDPYEAPPERQLQRPRRGAPPPVEEEDGEEEFEADQNQRWRGYADKQARASREADRPAKAAPPRRRPPPPAAEEEAGQREVRRPARRAAPPPAAAEEEDDPMDDEPAPRRAASRRPPPPAEEEYDDPDTAPPPRRARR